MRLQTAGFHLDRATGTRAETRTFVVAAADARWEYLPADAARELRLLLLFFFFVSHWEREK
jgi:hypothetical protein